MLKLQTPTIGLINDVLYIHTGLAAIMSSTFFYHFFLLLKQTFRSPKRYMNVHVSICLGDLRSTIRLWCNLKRIFNIQKFICDCQSLTRCNYTIALCKKHIEK